LPTEYVLTRLAAPRKAPDVEILLQKLHLAELIQARDTCQAIAAMTEVRINHYKSNEDRVSLPSMNWLEPTGHVGFMTTMSGRLPLRLSSEAIEARMKIWLDRIVNEAEIPQETRLALSDAGDGLRRRPDVHKNDPNRSDFDLSEDLDEVDPRDPNADIKRSLRMIEQEQIIVNEEIQEARRKLNPLHVDSLLRDRPPSPYV
jgi:hypothetical protein